MTGIRLAANNEYESITVQATLPAFQVKTKNSANFHVDAFLDLGNDYMWGLLEVHMMITGDNFPVYNCFYDAALYSADPVLARQNVDRTIVIVQGSTGLRNINIAGAIQYQLVPL